MAAPPAPGSFVQLGGHYAGNSPAAAMIKEMRTHFDAQTRFTFEGLLGRGTFGMTFRVLERLGRNARRRLAIKRAGSSRMYMELRTEISYLRVSGRSGPYFRLTTCWHMGKGAWFLPDTG